MSDACRVFSRHQIYSPNDAYKLLKSTNNSNMGVEMPQASFNDLATGMPVLKAKVFREQDFNGDQSPGEVFYVQERSGFYHEGKRFKAGFFLDYNSSCSEEETPSLPGSIPLGSHRIKEYYIADFNKDGSQDVGFLLTDGSLILFYGANSKTPVAQF